MTLFKTFFLSILALLGTSCLLALGFLFYLMTTPWIDFTVLERYNPGKPSLVLDDAGKEIMRFQLDRREPISYARMNPTVIQAFLAAEDQDFFMHHGISWRGILRSIKTNMTRRKIVQGASTITQQLVKLLFLDSRRTFERKIKELCIALVTEQQFSKEQILETYLNHIYLGCGIYGVEAASQRFWAKHTHELSLAQAATLAGIVRSPEKNCPLTNPDIALIRRNTILKSLYLWKKITAQEYEYARNEKLQLQSTQEECCAPHARELVRQWVEQRFGKGMLYTGGLIIQTTLTSPVQKKCTAVFKKNLNALRAYYKADLDGGLIILDGQSGAIKALVGGYDFSKSQFNRATQARRQIGSTIKPVVYATALDHGAQMTDVLVDEPLIFKEALSEWAPNNYNHKFLGDMTRAFALYKSNNIIAIKTLLQAGIPHVIEKIRACGLSGPFPPYPSLALGCVDGTVTEVATLFNVFAQRGMYTEPYLINWVKDNSGTKIWKYKPLHKQIFSWETTSQIGRVLISGMEKLQARMPHLFPECQIMGKTGTTNDARSCWFTGATSRYTTAMYIGNDNNDSMGSAVYASQTVVPLFLELMRELPETKLHEPFRISPHLQQATVHELTGQQIFDSQHPHALRVALPLAATR